MFLGGHFQHTRAHTATCTLSLPSSLYLSFSFSLSLSLALSLCLSVFISIFLSYFFLLELSRLNCIPLYYISVSCSLSPYSCILFIPSFHIFHPTCARLTRIYLYLDGSTAVVCNTIPVRGCDTQ